jgi:thiamine-phosphate pyrophosphorylase
MTHHPQQTKRTKVPHAFGFYAILTDPFRGYDYLTKLAVRYRLAFVQLRMKDASEQELLEVARRMRALTLGSATRFIVNDSPHIAAQVGADGVHIGQGDCSYAEARAIVGEQALVGISTHTPEQTRAACALNPDYIGVGPVWPTPTKKVSDAAIGIQGMRTMLEVATVPAVVLGSISLERIAEVRGAGAQNFALVRPLNQASNPEAVIREVLDCGAGHAGY